MTSGFKCKQKANIPITNVNKKLAFGFKCKQKADIPIKMQTNSSIYFHNAKKADIDIKNVNKFPKHLEM